MYQKNASHEGVDSVVQKYTLAKKLYYVRLVGSTFLVLLLFTINNMVIVLSVYFRDVHTDQLL